MQRGKEGIAWGPSLPHHPGLELVMILRLAPGDVNHTTRGLGFVVVVVVGVTVISTIFFSMKKENLLRTY